MQTAALVLVLLTSPSPAATDADLLALGRRLSADFWAGRLEPVWAQMNERMRAAHGGTPDGLSKIREQLLTLSGGPGQTLGERVAEVQGLQVYLRTFQGKDAPQPALEQWVIDDGRKVAGFSVRPTHLTLETQPETANSTPRYRLAAFLLLGTALSMGALGFWLRRPSRVP